ncbi:MAG: saccharopine dehydrogenase [Caldithrix sp. RBG_13_44_9]|nr:MAG: saccharopine dehydrogenase [Caldithrix sp. RBG_13_44_9]
MKKFTIVIAGAGGIGRAAGLLLQELGDFEADIFLGDRYESAAKSARDWVRKESNRTGRVEYFVMPKKDSDQAFDELLSRADIILDCLPGNQAPRMARLALQHKLHYVNLTEYVKETNEVMEMARNADKGFILQAGLAPGFINVLVNGLFQKFCKDFKVTQVESVNLKVGALTQNAYPPYFYGFTWSPVGVATLYVEPAKIIRNNEIVIKASLTERSKIILHGTEYEEDLTSGGAADLPESLVGKTRSLDYKTLRYPGHYDWIESILRQIPYGEDKVQGLQKKMEELIPAVEDDQVVIYASVTGKDNQGHLKILEKYFLIKPVEIGRKTMRAIQATTAAGLAECARLLLLGKYNGCILQSQIDPQSYLNGPFISAVYQSRN